MKIQFGSKNTVVTPSTKEGEATKYKYAYFQQTTILVKPNKIDVQKGEIS